MLHPAAYARASKNEAFGGKDEVQVTVPGAGAGVAPSHKMLNLREGNGPKSVCDSPEKSHVEYPPHV